MQDDKKLDEPFDYKYSSFRHLLADVWPGVLDWFAVFFRSYEKNKLTWVLQSLNLFLVLCLLYLVSIPVANKMRSLVSAWGVTSGIRLNIAMIAGTLFGISKLTKSPLCQWQTIYYMDRKFSGLFALFLVVLNPLAYWLIYIAKIFAPTASALPPTSEKLK